MNTSTTAHTFGAWLVLLAIANMAMFIRMAINSHGPAKIFVTIYTLATIPIVVAYSHYNQIEQSFALVLAFATLAAPITGYSIIHRNNVRAAVINAPFLSKWILQNFKELDVDGDGKISSADLFSYCQNPNVDLDNLKMARKVQFELYAIGHVIDVMVDCYPTVGFAVSYVYAISEDDVKTYPQRMVDAEEQEYCA